MIYVKNIGTKTISSHNVLVVSRGNAVWMWTEPPANLNKMFYDHSNSLQEVATLAPASDWQSFFYWLYIIIFYLIQIYRVFLAYTVFSNNHHS